MPDRPRHVLPIVLLAQFAGTSLWLTGNAVLADLQREFGLPAAAVGGMTSAVQAGFICGTLSYAVLTIADRFSPSRVFLLSALAGAVVNLGVGTVARDYPSILALRFATGFFLAGIYPVGMKIAADWFEAGLGRALGFLVGALVLGSAFPHLLRSATGDLPWALVLQGTSLLAAAGGVAVGMLVPDGPYRTPSRGFRASAVVQTFRLRDFRAAAFGYFGHMWELYGFWTFVPALLAARLTGAGPDTVSLLTFCVIALGGLGSVSGGYASERWGSARVAAALLSVSGLLCLASPLLFALEVIPFLILVGLWGFAVVADSPQFSTLVARSAPADLRGSALTMVNCLGFALTIPAIQALSAVIAHVPTEQAFLLLALGPVAGVAAVRRLVRQRI